MKISIDKEKCIKCGLCASICPEVFTFKENGPEVIENASSIVINDKEILEKLQMAKEGCPVEGIKIEE